MSLLLESVGQVVAVTDREGHLTVELRHEIFRLIHKFAGKLAHLGSDVEMRQGKQDLIRQTLLRHRAITRSATITPCNCFPRTTLHYPISSRSIPCLLLRNPLFRSRPRAHCVV
jgi:hypothetical protein